MKPIKTLILYSRGAPTVSQIVIDTALRGVLKTPYDVAAPAWLNKLGWAGEKIAKKINDPYAALGYINDWREAFKSTSDLDLIECNINDLIAYKRIKPILKDIPLIVVLHSSAGDDIRLLLATSHWFQDRKGKLAVFFGNEYDLMKDKKGFLIQSGADYICTQLPSNAADFLYGDVAGTEIIEMPHALNPSVYKPVAQRDTRKIKIGFIGARYPNWIGDTVRNDFIDYCNTAIDEADKFIKIGEGNITREHWAKFLNTCRGTVGAEAGTYYLDKEGLVLQAAKRLRDNESDLSKKIFNQGGLLGNVRCVSGKAISSRHFEPMGTKTVQILIEGEYNGILKPDVHYLSVKKDFSNFPDKLREFNDPYRQDEVANCAFEYAMDCHTYERRVNKFIEVVSESVTTKIII